MAWRQERIRVYGREHAVPRLTAWYGDRGATYTYSGIRHEPQPWSPTLVAMRERIEAAAGARFNSVLLNRYRTGADSNGWHADDEPELGPAPVIASVSLGAARRFALRRRGETRRLVTLVLEHGSLLIMSGRSQQEYQHTVPKEARVAGERINLTFRLVAATVSAETID